jgi:hypothetical protein
MDRGVEIARVWSFSDDLAQTPYVVKHGTRNGWYCNCPQHTIRHRTCKHITSTRDFKKQPPEIQAKIKLNEAGMKLLKVTEADLVQGSLPGVS